MRRIANILIVIMLLVFTGCSKDQAQLSNSQKLSPASEKVVENFYKYWNEKNSKAILYTLTERYDVSPMDWEFGNLKSVKLDSIKEESNTELVVIYKVKFTLKNKKNGIGSMNSGKYTWSFTVIRKDKNSPWLIDNYGEG